MIIGVFLYTVISDEILDIIIFQFFNNTLYEHYHYNPFDQIIKIYLF
jgi:hypothetical protein